MKACIERRGKRLVLTFLLLVIASTAALFSTLDSVRAEETAETEETANGYGVVVESGKCGATEANKLIWTVYDSDQDGRPDTLVISGEGAMADYDASSNLPPWKKYRREIVTLKLEKGMTSIGDYAFSVFPLLMRKLELPEELTTIGDCAFRYSMGLTEDLVLPEKLETIGLDAFLGCNNIKTIYIPKKVTKIGFNAFDRSQTENKPKIYNLSSVNLDGNMDNRELGENFTISRSAVGSATEATITTVYGDGKQSYTFTAEDLPKALDGKMIGSWFYTQTDGTKVPLYVGEPVTVTENIVVKAEDIISLAEPITANGITASIDIIDFGAITGNPINVTLTLEGTATQGGRMALNIDAGKDVEMQTESGSPNTLDVTEGQAMTPENVYTYTFYPPEDEITLTPKLQFAEHGVQLEVDGKTTSYTDLAAALNAVPINTTTKLTLLKDQTLDTALRVEGKAEEVGTTVTLEMNDHSISGASTDPLLFLERDNWSLEISGTGSLSNTGSGAAIDYSSRNGKLIFSGHADVVGGGGESIPAIAASGSTVSLKDEAHIKNKGGQGENPAIVCDALVINGGTLEGFAKTKNTYYNVDTKVSVKEGEVWYLLDSKIDTTKGTLSYNSENITTYDEKNYAKFSKDNSTITFTLTPLGGNVIFELPKVTYGEDQTEVKVTKTSPEDYRKIGQALTFTFTHPERPVTLSASIGKQQNTITVVETSKNFKQDYNGEPKTLSSKKGEDFTWLGTAEADATIKYYTDKEGTLTNASDEESENDGQAPVGAGMYYAKVTVPEEAAYLETTLDYIPFEILKVNVPEGAYGVKIDGGSCGKTEADPLSWAVYDSEQNGKTDVLVISGEGAMVDYDSESNLPPWKEKKYHSEIVTLKLDGKITSIGDNAFADCTKLTGNLILSERLTTLGTKAFYFCDNIETIYIPKNVTAIGDFAFNRSKTENKPKIYNLSSVDLSKSMENRELGENFTIKRPAMGDAAEETITTVYGDGKQSYTFTEKDLPNIVGGKIVGKWFYNTQDGKKENLKVGDTLQMTGNITIEAEKIISLAEPVTANGITAEVQVADPKAITGASVKAVLKLTGTALESGVMDLNIDAEKNVVSPGQGVPGTLEVSKGQVMSSENTYTYTFYFPDAEVTLTPKLQFTEFGAQLKVGEKTTGYVNLADAFNAIPINSEATITLLKDMTVDTSMIIMDKLLDLGTTVTLDTNNHTLSRQSSSPLLIIRRGQFTLKIIGSGSLSNTGTGLAMDYASKNGKLILSDQVIVSGGRGSRIPVIKASDSTVRIENEAQVQNNVAGDEFLINGNKAVIKNGALKGFVQTKDTYYDVAAAVSTKTGNVWYLLNTTVDAAKGKVSYSSENTTTNDEKSYGKFGSTITFTLTPTENNAIFELPTVVYGDNQTVGDVTKTSPEDYNQIGQALTFTFTQPESPAAISAVLKEANTIKAAEASKSFKQDYTGQPRILALEKGKDFTWLGTAETAKTIQYYTDKEGTLTNTEDWKPQNDGQAPKLPGKYYVKVTVPADAGYYETTSDYVPFEIQKVNLPEGAYGVKIASGSCGKTSTDTLEWTIYDTKQNGKNDLLVISGNGAMADYGTKSSDNHVPWLRYSWFQRLKLEEGITHIGNNAFGYEIYSEEDNDLASSLEIPKSVTSIGENAFLNCSELTGNLVLPEGLTFIGAHAFNMCRRLEGDLILPKGLTTIEEGAFADCTGLKGEFVLPKDLTTIGGSAFGNCAGLKGELVLPKGLTTIGEFAFSNCTGLKGELVLPEKLTTIGMGAFSHCTGLKGDLVLPKDLTTIEKWTFSDCDNIKTIYIPKNVKVIGDSAFNRSKPGNNPKIYNLSSVDLTDKMANRELGENFTITRSAMGSTAETVLTTVYGDGKQTYTFTAEELPDRLGNEIINSWFYTQADGNVVPVKVGTSLPVTQNMVVEAKSENIYGKKIDSGSCGKTDADKLIWTVYDSTKDGVADTLVISGEGEMTDRTPPWEAYASEIVTLKLEEGMTSIGRGTFNNSRERYAKLDCSLEIPTTVKTIGSRAFGSCSGLKGDFILPEGLTTIASGAFYNCKNLTGDLAFPETVTTIESSAFEKCSGLNGKLVLPEGLTTIARRAFYDCENLTGDLVFPETVTVIEGQAFQKCSGLDGKLVLSEGLTMIGDAAFSDCVGLTGGLVLPEGLTTIEDSVFSGCVGLSGSLVLPKGLTTIGEEAFFACGRLTGDLVLPEGLTTIGSQAFLGCALLSGDLVLPEGLTTIEDVAFLECDNIKTIYIPKNVKEIGSNAFNRSKPGNNPKIYNLSSVDLTGKMRNRELGENFTITRLAVGSTAETVLTTVYGDGKQTYTFKDIDLPSTLDGVAIEEWFYTRPTENGSEKISLHVGDTLEVTGNMTLFAGYTVALNASVKENDGAITVATLEGGGTYPIGDEVSITAPEKPGYKFLGWYEAIEGSPGYDSEQAPVGIALDYRFSITRNTKLVAVYEVNPSATVQITGTGFTVQYGGVISEEQTQNYTKELPTGTVVTVTAAQPDTFLYWENANDKIMSQEAVYSFTVTGQTDLTLTRKEIKEKQAYVEFLSPYQQVMASGIYTVDSSELELPTNLPSKVGYEFEKWSKTVEEIREAIRNGETQITVTPVYKLKTDTYKLSIYKAFEGKLIEETPEVTPGNKGGSSKTITAEPVTGKRFKCWAADMKGTQILGTDEAYFLQFNSDVTLYAIYVSPETSVIKVPTITITNVFATSVGEKHKLSFAATRSVPEGYTLLEHGMLYNKDGSITDPTEESFNIGGTGVRQYKASDQTAKGVFTFNVRTQGDDMPVYGRAYMILKEKKTGNQQVVYSTLRQAKFTDFK